MIEKKEEILQAQIERGEPHPYNDDSRAYGILFSVLKKQPELTVPSSFAQSVVNRLAQIKERRATRKDHVWMAIGLFSFLIASVISAIITEFRFTVGIFWFLANYGGLVIFGGAFVAFLLWIEKQILPPKTV